jgi:glycosyltransferase involved in cell wall biosynthesis
VRVAYPYPGYWPYTRRGGERLVHDLAGYVARQGHEVHVIASTPGRPRRADDGGVQVNYVRQLSHPLLYRYSPVLRQLGYAAQATRAVAELRPDVAHFFTYSNIPWPALRHAARPPYLFQSIVLKDRFPRTFWQPLFVETMRRADRVVALTEGGARAVEAEYGVSCGVLPPPVDMDEFRPCAPRADRPEVLFTADLADGWKGGNLLLRAWNLVHSACPEAVLVLAGPYGMAGWTGSLYPHTMLRQLDLVRDPRARAAIEVRGTGAVGSLPAWYSSASVTVLPSIREAFGLVLTESLACGTPVVGSSHDGPGEIIRDPAIGATVDLQDFDDLLGTARADDLAAAILHCIDLAQQPATAARCRDWASRWSLQDAVGPAYLALLEEVASGSRESAA